MSEVWKVTNECRNADQKRGKYEVHTILERP